ncbi:MAG: GPW/gp25 family protein [Pseudomonadota bacterium]
MTTLSVFKGMDPLTGRAVFDLDHVRQSVRDILSTPVGTRVQRRTFGSTLYKLLDAPMTEGLLAEVRAAVAGALTRWEPRLRLVKVRAYEATPGRLDVDLEAVYENQSLVLAGVLE